MLGFFPACRQASDADQAQATSNFPTLLISFTPWDQLINGPEQGETTPQTSQPVKTPHANPHFPDADNPQGCGNSY